ncbi:general odorant-binding protein 67 [Anopheles arabiensis]|uniref:OBP47-like domain-containing protein n=1 Tax=Anopheles arabiensis TaxID=7173 RepID=A0A2C9GS35_ANOAR|nr:general odorant-binding protein 67 [Anopheles arabiensis]
MNRLACAFGVIFVVATLELVLAHPGKDVLGCHNGTSITVDECCAIPMLANKTVIEKCKAAHPFKPPQNTDDKGPRGHPGECIAECIMKGMGALKNEKVDGPAFRKAIEPVVKANPAFAKLLDDTVKKCHESINVDSEFTRYVTKPVCKPDAKAFINCVYGTLFEQCPTNVWTQKDGCTQLKDKIKKGCAYFALRKHGGRRMRPT